MTLLRYCLIALVTLCLAACAMPGQVQVSFDETSATTTYTSSRSLMGYRDMSGGLASNQRVMWSAEASCAGEACTPDTVDLIFYNDSSGDLNFDFHRLWLIFDGTQREWEDLSRVENRTVFTVPRGVFTQVTLSGADFARMASSKTVEIHFGESGTSVFSIPLDRRAAFRAFVEKTGL